MEQTVEDYESLKADNFTLKKELDSIKLELDKANQQLYECQRNVKVLTTVQAEYQNEVDMLQSEQIKQKQKYQDIIKQLEQNINSMRESYNDEKQTFENVIMRMEEKNELMKNELCVYKGSYENNVTTNFGDTSSLIQDILSDPPEFYENQQLKDTVKELQSKNEILTRHIEEYTSEIEDLKESLKFTRTDLHEANTNNQFLNDEILCLKTELDSLKNQPLNKDSRGNSLFAEVDDRSSRQSYGDDAIGYVQLKREGNICIVKCRICPEHKVHGKTYSATMIINEEEGKIISVECHDCAASQGGCKHAVAFLMWVHRRSEEPSCTSVECYWKKSQLAKVGTTLKFITTTELSRGRPKSSSLSDSRVLFKFLEEGKKRKLDTCQLMKYQENAEIRDVEMLSLHQLSFKYPEKCAEVFLQKVAHTFSDILKTIENETRNQSKNSLWYELRYGRITASKAYEVSRCKTSDGTLYATIMGGKIPDTFAMKRGRTMEDAVRKLLEEKFERKIVKCGLFISKHYPMIAGSPDGISNESVIEIKCPLSMKTFHNYIKEGRIDKKFCAQIQLQMYLAKLKTGFFCVADPDFTNNQKVEIINVNFDKEYVDNLLDILSTFWKNNIYPLLYKNSL